MRITFVLPLPTLAGGVRVVAEYARHLSDRGHEVLVVSTAARPRETVGRRLRVKLSDLKRRLRGKPVPDRTFRLPPSHVDTLGGLSRRVPHGGPITDGEVPDADVVISTWWETVPWVAAMSPAKGRKVHFLQHDERAMARSPEQAERIGETTWKTPGFARVAVANWIAGVGRDEYGVRDCVVVPNAVDATLFHAGPRGRGEPPTLGFMNSPAGFKASEIAQAAYELAKRELPDLRLRTFGSADDPNRPLPREAMHEHAPPQSRIPEIYRSCDVWLFSSRCEGFGLPILEAMACGTPVVGTPTGAAPDLIDGSNGTLVPIDDPAAMARAAIELLTRPEPAWRAASEAARATAARHDYASATDRFEAFLRSVG